MTKMMVLALSMVFLAACNKAGAPTTEEVPAAGTVETEQTQEQTNEGLGMQEQSQSSSVDVIGDDFTFSVTEIKATQGQNLTINFTNEEGFHDFVIDELNVNTGMVAAGATKSVTIPTDRPGTYEFYCSVGDHRERGMKGLLIIE